MTFRAARHCWRISFIGPIIGPNESSGWPAKELFMTVRVAVTGKAATPPLFETMAVLGKEICRRRLRRAAESLR